MGRTTAGLLVRRLLDTYPSTRSPTHLTTSHASQAPDQRKQAGKGSVRTPQYVAVRYGERLAEVASVASVGSVGDSCDNAMAEAFNSLFKAELVRNRGPWGKGSSS